MNYATKEHLIAQFRAYLDVVEGVHPLTIEEPGREIDLFTLFSELAALKNEVKLESRQVKTALDQFREVFDTLRQDNARLGEELGRRRDTEQEARCAAQRELLLEILDLHDRLRAGLE
jgi:molecular chaperone GrpE